MNQDKPSLSDLRITRDENAGSPRRAWPFVATGVLMVVAAGVWWFLQPKIPAVQTMAAREVAAGGPERTVLNASGYVTARRAATVSSKVTGKVIEVLVEEGLRVQEGQVLARLDDTNVKASLRLAEAQLQSTRASLEETRVRVQEAERELQRQARLEQNKIATQADLDHADASVKALKAKLEQQNADVTVAERQVASWQQQLEDTIIRAPFEGVVTAKNAQPGEMISPMSAGGSYTRTGICTIVDMQSLEVEIDVNESYINRVQAGQPVEATLDSYPDWKIPSKVIAIIPTADRQKSTVKVRVGFDKLDPRILPEMGIKVAFREASADGLAAARQVVIPKVAIQQAGGRDVVFVVQNGRVERRAVTVSATRDDQAVIEGGLAAGEKVTLNPPLGLADGSRVREVEGAKP